MKRDDALIFFKYGYDMGLKLGKINRKNNPRSISLYEENLIENEQFQNIVDTDFNEFCNSWINIIDDYEWKYNKTGV